MMIHAGCCPAELLVLVGDKHVYTVQVGRYLDFKHC